MKEFIANSGKSIKEFSEFYGIPYNTVRQWANGERNAPDWVKNLINKAANGIQQEIDIKPKIYPAYNQEIYYATDIKNKNNQFRKFFKEEYEAKRFIEMWEKQPTNIHAILEKWEKI